nr:hypothetical protein [Plasmopara viticola lesion associated mononegaambi virus 5]
MAQPMHHSVDSLIDTYLGNFIDQELTNHTLESTFMVNLTHDGSVPIQTVAYFDRVMLDLKATRGLSARVYSHRVFGLSTPLQTSLITVDRIQELVYGKIRKAIIKAGKEIVDENPAYFRSHRFTVLQFARMSICRSAVSPRLLNKWARLSEKTRSLNLRLSLLNGVMNCVQELISEAKGFEGEGDTYNEFVRGNRQLTFCLSEISAIIQANQMYV